MNIDLHVHTNYSYDGYQSLHALDDACRKKNITTVAITDHNEIDGAIMAQKLSNNGILKTQIIIGEEISSNQGEIIGLFLKEKILSGMSIIDTVQAIKDQGGLVYLNHPFGYAQRAQKLELSSLENIWDLIDIIEVFNGRNMHQDMNTRALELAKTRKKPMAVGTDAHSAWEVGRSYFSLPNWDTPQDFLKACSQLKTWVARPCPLWYRILFKARKMAFSRPLPRPI